MELTTFVLDLHNFYGDLLIFLFLADSFEHFTEPSLSQKAVLILLIHLKDVLVDSELTFRNIEVM